MLTVAPHRLNRRNRQTGCVILLLTILCVHGSHSAAQTSISPSWLQDLNAYRAAAGLPALAENVAWSDGATQHARYAVKTDTFLATENPASVWYSAAGASAAAASIGLIAPSSSTSDRSALDRWMRSPFTALAILNPGLQATGFGSYREAGGAIHMSAWLDVTRGRGPVPAAITFPLTWPVNGATIPLPSSDDCAQENCVEYPSILESCPGFSHPRGFPLILQLGPASKPPVVSHSSLLQQGGQPLEHCVIDEGTFRHSESIQRITGRAFLSMNHAVVIIPKSPLTVGTHYTASVTVNGSIHKWSFDVLSTGGTPTTGGGDADGDGLPSGWETSYGLDPSSGSGENGPSGDPDKDGRTNITEYHDGTHPKGFHTRYFAEGATSTFFDVSVALANPTIRAASVLLRFLSTDGTIRSHSLSVPPLARRTVRPRDLPGLEKAEFSTVIESDVEVVVDRTMTWDASGYGSHTETSIAAPAATWYLAEGATHSGFNLFYLIQNPTSAPATIQVRYLLPAPAAPLQKRYTLAPSSRFTIWVNQEDPVLAATDVSAMITVPSGGPVIVERAMYLDTQGQMFGAGHASAGITAAATTWFLAEGATGNYFDLFVLIANPNDTTAQVMATYLLPTGVTVTKPYTVAANSRFTIWVDNEDAALADTAVSTTITSMNGVPIIVERAMWWPGSVANWQEAHNGAGATVTGTKWALAEGELGGSNTVETYILVANTSAFAGSAKVTLLFEDATTVSKTFALNPSSRFNVSVAAEFPAAAGKRFGALVESVGASPAQLVVERAMYSNANGVVWAAGTNALARRIE